MKKITIIEEAIRESVKLLKDGIPEKEVPLYLDPMIPQDVISGIIKIALKRISD